jgi:hypothetical protein
MSVNKSKWYSVEILLLSAHFVKIRVKEEVLDFFFFFFFFFCRGKPKNMMKNIFFFIRANKWTVDMKPILDSSWEKN